MMTDNVSIDNEIYTLENWKLEKIDCDYIAHGRVYNSPKFINGHRIHTSPIIKFETGETEYYVHTLNSIYSLPMDSYIGLADVQKILDDLATQKQKALECAEKLLSEGDCLFFEYNVFYRTNKGVICLNHQSVPHQYVSYKYEPDGFELRAYNTIDFFVRLRFNESHRNCALYEISFYNHHLKKSDYKFCEINKKHNLQEVQYDQSIPF